MLELMYYGNEHFYTKDGVICCTKRKKVYKEEFCQDFKKYLRSVGITYFRKEDWVKFLGESIDKPESVLFEEVRRRHERALKRRRSTNSLRQWRENEMVVFGGMVLGIDRSSFVLTDRDFSFFISLRSCPYKEQVEFVRSNSKKLKEYAEAKVQEYYLFKRHIGSLDYYYLSDMVVTRDSQVCFVFSIRKEIEEILSGKDDKEAM